MLKWLHREIGSIAGSDGCVTMLLTSTDGLETKITLNKKSEPHSFDDNPCVSRSDGTLEYYKNGLLHRDSGPAVITKYDTRFIPPLNPETATEEELKRYECQPDYEHPKGETIKFFREGKLHDPDMNTPAVQYPDGSYIHYKHGKKHRRKEPALKYKDGTVEYWVNGEYHSKKEYAHDSPRGPKMSYVNGRLNSIQNRPSIVHENGDKEWHLDGLLHRFEDLPAIERADGTKEWYTHGKRDRKDGPALIKSDWTLSYYLDGKLHRQDGPAVIRPDGTQEWYYKGKRHNENGPALLMPDGTRIYYFADHIQSINDSPAVIRPDGTREWYEKDDLHRVNGPALIETDGTEHYYFNGKRHRTNGPAIVRKDGTNEWYIRGKKQNKRLSTIADRIPNILPLSDSPNCTIKRTRPESYITGTEGTKNIKETVSVSGSMFRQRSSSKLND